MLVTGASVGLVLGTGAVLLDWVCLVPDLNCWTDVLGTGAVSLDWVCLVPELSVGLCVLSTGANC